ncbi:hypothetical protein LJC63_08610 [Ruminococcaceae bacterium OttesenSCG-928-L11]|nr:hypothetical protein [Ruminococcaceae bacterium OttesenSCG-928-L11]
MITTACVGMAVGTAAYMMNGNRTMRGKTRKFKRTAGKALRQAGEFIGNMSYMMK